MFEMPEQREGLSKRAKWLIGVAAGGMIIVFGIGDPIYDATLGKDEPPPKSVPYDFNDANTWLIPYFKEHTFPGDWISDKLRNDEWDRSLAGPAEIPTLPAGIDLAAGSVALAQ